MQHDPCTIQSQRREVPLQGKTKCRELEFEEGASYPSPETIARFWEKVNKKAKNGCWEWTACLNDAGYGKFCVSERRLLAHRVSLFLTGVHLPLNLVADHKCRNRKCVNPQHLRLVSIKANALENSISPVAQNAGKTHCDRGHLLSGKNLYITLGRKTRSCRICQNQFSRNYKAKKRQAKKLRLDTFNKSRYFVTMENKAAISHPNTIGDNIRKAREALGLTQLNVAHKIGYQGDDAGAYICRLEAGSQEPRISTLHRIATALGVSIGQLVRSHAGSRAK